MRTAQPAAPTFSSSLPTINALIAELMELLQKRMIVAGDNEPDRRGNHSKSTKGAK